MKAIFIQFIVFLFFASSVQCKLFLSPIKRPMWSNSMESVNSESGAVCCHDSLTKSNLTCANSVCCQVSGLTPCSPDTYTCIPNGSTCCSNGEYCRSGKSCCSSETIDNTSLMQSNVDIITIVGASIGAGGGFLIMIFSLIGLLVFFCCCQTSNPTTNRQVVNTFQNTFGQGREMFQTNMNTLTNDTSNNNNNY
ncbi:hypothetical protein C9374_012195 [Naegleria lovaniensis]|uniref:Uncharacterized protein n=1 Tax=Naegleria lovaniensis TaxID=51637 RepID=A0AA88GCU9_NAELO|nr:uncharacterized protein C9374_012195 [Naegleria lovaniensis]KAG2373329.1 hypothetical protein C9374_012195 [Naegleria lovaniensis]